MRTSPALAGNRPRHGPRLAGDLLFIEAGSTPGGGRLLLTGQLGDVMQGKARRRR
ncbi:S16 family serine protease [Cupriavidus basilensis]